MFSLEFTPCKVEQSLQGMKLQEKQEEKDKQHIGKLIRKKAKMPINSRLKSI